ncbi:MAG: proteasome-type protease [Betaproteobacteria bacterium]|nr:proteasome-type protease [Betaproteobacteria bacterium]
MTYCVAVMLDAGMVFASDSRTNAGVDQIATFSKMHMIKRDGERLIVVLSSGNLSITQSAINLLEHQSKSGDANRTINNASSMFEIADLIGNALREVRRRDGPYLAQSNIEAGASFVVGGQIRGEPQRLFHVYSEGNFIEATPETPYFQIGESKYGKPVIDRVINRHTNLLDAAKCVLVSFDSTMRSNISVGLPIDLLVYHNNSLHPGIVRRIDESDPYFNMIHNQWGEGLKRVFAQIPNPQWDDAG